MTRIYKYKSCDHVPFGMAPSTHNGCKPKYCYSEKKRVGSRKNWSRCTPRYTYQSSFVKNQRM